MQKLRELNETPSRQKTTTSTATEKDADDFVAFSSDDDEAESGNDSEMVDGRVDTTSAEVTDKNQATGQGKSKVSFRFILLILCVDF